MQREGHENRALLRGRAAGAPVLSHQNHGEDYFSFPLAVPRLSGTEDTLNILVSARLLQSCPVVPDKTVEAEGEIRSFNNRNGTGSRLVITLFARRLEFSEEEPCNVVLLSGTLCKPPVLRRTPLGRDICDILLAVNRHYGRADYLPCISWGTLATTCGSLKVGEGVTLEGRLQSREYRKLVGGESQTRVAFEVSVMRLQIKTDADL